MSNKYTSKLCILYSTYHVIYTIFCVEQYVQNKCSMHSMYSTYYSMQYVGCEFRCTREVGKNMGTCPIQLQYNLFLGDLTGDAYWHGKPIEGTLEPLPAPEKPLVPLHSGATLTLCNCSIEASCAPRSSSTVPPSGWPRPLHAFSCYNS